jgi:hypothetical protein
MVGSAGIGRRRRGDCSCKRFVRRGRSRLLDRSLHPSRCCRSNPESASRAPRNRPDEQHGVTDSGISDDELTDRLEGQELGGNGVSHIDHVRVGWVLHRRHGPAQAEERLVEGRGRAVITTASRRSSTSTSHGCGPGRSRAQRETIRTQQRSRSSSPATRTCGAATSSASVDFVSASRFRGKSGEMEISRDLTGRARKFVRTWIDLSSRASTRRSTTQSTTA